MTHSTDDYASRVHPTHAYESPDLAIAYIEREERITARCLVWPDKKKRSTVYGDHERIIPLLHAAGYKDDNQSFDGARLKKIPCRGTYVVPYVDGHGYGYVDNDYIIIGDKSGKKSVGLQNTHGLGSGYYDDYDDDDEYTCENCDETNNNDDRQYISNADEWWCLDCVEAHAFGSDFDDNLYTDDVAHHMGNGDVWTEEQFEQWGTVCDRCDGHVHKGTTSSVTNTNVNATETWCPSCVLEETVQCARTHVRIPTEQAVHVNNRYYVSPTYFENNGCVCAGNGRNYERRYCVLSAADDQWYSREYLRENPVTTCACGSPDPNGVCSCLLQAANETDRRAVSA